MEDDCANLTLKVIAKSCKAEKILHEKNHHFFFASSVLTIIEELKPTFVFQKGSKLPIVVLQV